MIDDLFNRARYAFLTGDLSQAEELCLRHVENQPEDTVGRLLLGSIYIKEAKLQSAQQVFEALTQDEPENPEAWINAALVYSKRGQLKTALRAAQKAYRLSGSRGDIIFNIGNIHKQLGELKKAEQIYRLSIEKQADFIPSYNNLALLLSDSGRADEAENIIKQGLRIDENHPVLHFNLAGLYRSGGKTELAVEEFKAALKLKPGWEECLLAIGDLKKDQNPKEASRMYERVLDLSPASAEASCRLGEIELTNGNTEGAEIIFSKILTAFPDFTPAAVNLAAVYYSRKNLPKAENLLRKHLAENSENHNLRILLSNILLDLGKYNEAFTNIRFVLDRNQNESRAWFAMARQFSLSGKKNKAINTYRKGLNISPDSHEDRMQFALLLKNQNKISSAIIECEYIHKQKPEEFAPALLLAKLYIEKQQFSRAASLLESICISHPDDIKLLLLYAETAKKAGDSGRALQAAEKLAAARNEDDEDFDISALNRNLEIYDEMAVEYAREYGSSWNRNLKILAKSFEPESKKIEEGSFLFDGLQDIAGEYVPIIDVGGIDPVIMFDEEEDELIITDEDEFIIPPEEDEDEPLKEEIEKHEEVTTTGGPGPGPTAPIASPTTPPAAAPPAPSAPINFGGPLTIRLETPPIIIKQQQLPPEPEPGEPEPEPAADVEEAPDEEIEEVYLPEPENDGAEDNIFSYLDKLTSFLPSDKKNEYNNSEARLKLAALKSRISGDPGLISRIQQNQLKRESVPVNLTTDRIGKTLGFMNSLTELLPDAGMAASLGARLKNILSRLDESGKEKVDEEKH
ncbi:MAG: tetratricopeptide repeat protein [Spirochaetales bacterium]|nr:tetratricopeptide repeat protein [Spirochaetales bacterium]